MGHNGGGGGGSAIKKTEKLTLKPFDIKKGGGLKIATSKPFNVIDNGMKDYLDPFRGQGSVAA